mmetsp:Transcript_11435/g.10944  ORF Transcript_11435/g.10944 Transcript_11435/m.10944 type:complete len:941 (-) Transcript_11435:188-3010(-)
MAVTIDRSCQSSHPASLAVLQALACISGVEGIDFSTESCDADKEGLKVVMKVSTKNSFNQASSTNNYEGLMGCARAMCNIFPESGLWGSCGKEGEASNIESWVEAASVALAVPAYVLSSEKAQAEECKKQVDEFSAKLETHLSKSDDAFLGGTIATAADVFVAILLAHAAATTSTKTLPEKTHKLLETILTNPMIASKLGKVDIPAAGDDLADSIESIQLDSTESFADNAIVQKLDSLNIPHLTYAHKLSVTVDELVANVPISEEETHTKNLFFKDKKHGLFLLTCKPDAEVNTKALGKSLNLGGKINLRLASEDILMECLGVKKGCVGPLAIMNNAEKNVTLILDEGLLAFKKIHSHPLTNDVSTVLTPDNLKLFLEKLEVEPVLLAFDSKSAASASGPPKAAAEAKKPQGKKGGAQQQAKSKNKDNKKTSKKGETLLALQWKKEENFAMWYSDVIVLSEMIAYYDISGCYILRPWSYKIWQLIQDWFNIEIEKLGVENSYFPLFVSQDRLEKEKDHVEGFAPEVAWVTKSGSDTLAKPIAIRPTSETIMYPAFSDWIRSHRDLPLKLNQWSNVVRWEFKDPTPFLRSREFLWQEGHTAHATYKDADKMVMQALDLYRQVYEDLLAVPVIPGFKTEKEKFAGGSQTTTCEAYIAGSGRAIQGATSHNLGQNFGKMFDINFQDENGKSQVVWQTSWGLTTRSIGVMVMVHGDDTGLVMPPRISPLQAVIVPIISKKLSYEDAAPYCDGILEDLVANGIRAKYDDRTMYNPGWKYNHWEQKGVPIRIEVGPRDMESKQARIVLRFNGEKLDMPVDGLGAVLKEKLDYIQKAMFEKAKDARDEHLVQITEWKDFVPNLELNNLVLTPWCGGEHQDWEEWVKDKSREESLKARGQELEDERTATSVAAKTLCIPFKQPDLPEGTKCIASGKPATCWVLWGRSY